MRYNRGNSHVGVYVYVFIYIINACVCTGIHTYLERVREKGREQEGEYKMTFAHHQFNVSFHQCFQGWNPLTPSYSFLYIYAGMLNCFNHVHVQLFVTSWTVDHQAPLSMRFSRQEYWSGLCPPPGNFPDPGIEPECLTFSALAGGFLTTSTTWEVHIHIYMYLFYRKHRRILQNLAILLLKYLK